MNYININKNPVINNKKSNPSKELLDKLESNYKSVYNSNLSQNNTNSSNSFNNLLNSNIFASKNNQSLNQNVSVLSNSNPQSSETQNNSFNNISSLLPLVQMMNKGKVTGENSQTSNALLDLLLKNMGNGNPMLTQLLPLLFKNLTKESAEKKEETNISSFQKTSEFNVDSNN